jgi:polyphosphate kinase
MTTEPNTITFHNSNTDWVMRITADRRIEVNEDVDVTEAAQKVLDVMQYLLKAQRTWVGLTAEEKKNIFLKWYGKQYTYTKQVQAVMNSVEAKLKEKNT